LTPDLDCQLLMLRPSLISLCLAAGVCACAHQPEGAERRTRQADQILRSEVEQISARVPARATLDSLLRANNLAAGPVNAAVASAASVFNPRALRADRPYRLVRTIDGLLREFEYEIDANRLLRIICPDRERPELLEATVVPIEKQTSVVSVTATIDAEHPSLISAVTGSGENIQLALSLAEIFSGSIDFDSDLQPGDGFDVVFEKSTRDGQFAGYGAIAAARFTAEGREHHAYRWTDPATGASDYYDEDGRSLKRFFLKSPLKFEFRVTSGFSLRRLHPIHRKYRAHLGVDYGAPYGSAVVAVASGVVVSAGRAGGGGNQVRLRHASGYESYYLHLSAFGARVRAGSRVEQGQVIGRVGATGTATGPHLDYRLRRNGVFVNPRAEHAKLPPGAPIGAAHLAAFRTQREAVTAMMPVSLEQPGNRPDAVRTRR
ncbi:MAG: M23 family metallopeptidase, partial [Vicinamibacterales bacterium]